MSLKHNGLTISHTAKTVLKFEPYISKPDIIMVGREEVHLEEEMARDVLYAGDAPLNEASLHKLLSGPALAICFRLLDTDKHFVCKLLVSITR